MIRAKKNRRWRVKVKRKMGARGTKAKWLAKKMNRKEIVENGSNWKAHKLRIRVGTRE